MESRWIESIIYSAGGLLVGAALTRFLIVLSAAQSLALPDPVVGIPLRLVVVLAGVVELAAAWFCLSGRQRRLQVGLLFWLATNLVVFHAGLFWMKIHPQGTFLGRLTDPLQLAGTITGLVVFWLPVAFVLASYAAAAGLWLESRRGAFQKMFCPGCGGHIKFATQNLGQEAACPHCQIGVTLRKPNENLKMTCYFCKGHIEFPAHAIGTRMPCPHCQMDITLKELQAR